MKLSLRRSVYIALLRTSGAGCSLLLSLIVARTAGANITGLYYTVTGLVSFLVIAICIGDQQRLLRSVSLEPEVSNQTLKYFLSIFIKRATTLSIIVCGVVFIVPLNEPSVNWVSALITVLAALFFITMQSCGSYYNGNDKQHYAAVYTAIAAPLSMLLIAYWFLDKNMAPWDMLAWFFSSYALCAAIALFGSQCAPHFHDIVRAPITPTTDSVKVLGSVLFTYFSNWSCTFLILVFGTQADVGVFNTVLRLTIVATIISGVLSAMSAPHFARISDTTVLQAHIFQNARYCLAMGVATLVPILVMGEVILSFFGNEFTTGYPALVIIITAKLICLSFGTVGNLLLQKGLYANQLVSVASGVVIQLLVGVVLIPTLPLTGAALAVACGVIVENLCQAFYAKRELGVFCFLGNFTWQKRTG